MFIQKLNVQKGGNLAVLKTAEIHTSGGLQGGNQIDEPLLLKLIGQRRL
jgi:hypothetical protein